MLKVLIACAEHSGDAAQMEAAKLARERQKEMKEDVINSKNLESPTPSSGKHSKQNAEAARRAAALASTLGSPRTKDKVEKPTVPMGIRSKQDGMKSKAQHWC